MSMFNNEIIVWALFVVGRRKRREWVGDVVKETTYEDPLHHKVVMSHFLADFILSQLVPTIYMSFLELFCKDICILSNEFVILT
jgi:hypothetical protein